MNFRHHRIGAAERKQRQNGKLNCQNGEHVGVGLHRRTHHASAMLAGTMTASTHKSGQRITPTAAAVASTTKGAGPMPPLNNGTTIFAAVEISRPAAPAAIPVRMRRNASMSPYCA